MGYNYDQELAVNSCAPDILVSASAGTGKTQVLVGRIIRLLRDARDDPSKPDIGNFLIVTFTRAATAEMRNRIENSINAELADDTAHAAFWRDQKRKLASAEICTIDSFCLDLLKNNFAEAGLSPGIKMVSETDIAPLRRRIIDDVLNEPEIKDSAAFAVECLSDGKTDFYKTLVDVYKSVINRPEGIEKVIENTAAEIEKCRSGGIYATVWGRDFLELSKKDFDFLAEVCDSLSADEGAVYAEFFKCYGERSKAFAGLCGEYLDDPHPGDARGFLERAEIISNAGKKQRFLTTKIAKNYGEETASRLYDIKETLKGTEGDFKENVKTAAENETEGRADSYAGLIGTVSRILLSFDRKLMSEKLSRGMLEFCDLQKLAYEVLKNSGNGVAAAAAGKYRVIFVDEYQDVSPIQDGIFSELRKAGSERFMVGDAKQCIYAFRNADPGIFNGYRVSKQIEQIYLNENFRSTKQIISFANSVSGSQLASFDGTVYDAGNDDLKPNKKTPDGPAPEIRAFSVESDEKGKKTGTADAQRADAAATAGRIKALHENEGVDYGDIAVLLRNRKPAAYYEEELEKAGIPFASSISGDLLKTPEVLLAVSLLNVLNNPSNDVHMASVMRSPIYGFTLTDLVVLNTPKEIKGRGLYEKVRRYPEIPGAEPALARKCEDFSERLAGYRKWAHLPVDEILWNLYSETGMLSVGSISTPDAEEKKLNLIAFHSVAAGFESGRFRGLYNFVDYINGMIADGEPLEKNTETSGSVRIMTCHTSKGLGMNTVFLPNLGKEISGGFSDKCFVDRNGLIVSDLLDGKRYTKVRTLIMESAKMRKGEAERAEELRLMYVMLTRAKNRLILSATSCEQNNAEKKIGKWESFAGLADPRRTENYIIRKASTFAEIIAAADRDIFKFEKYDPAREDAGEVPDAPAVTADPGVTGEIKRRLAADRLPLSPETGLPTKLAVTSLSGDLFDGDEDGIPVFSAAPSVPEFIAERNGARSGAAEKGTATHAFMQFCDFGNLAEKGFDDELARQVGGGYLSERDAGLVDRKVVEGFTRSGIFGRIMSTPAEMIHREYRFFVFLPADRFAESEEKKKELSGREIFVQGAIDLLIEDDDGGITIVDYKTDSMRRGQTAGEFADEMRRKHGDQLENYRLAAEEVFGKPVRRTVIYSFAAGMEIETGTAGAC